MECDKESQKPIVPEDLFRNCFTWSCYEICNAWVPWVISGLCIFLEVAVIKLIITYELLSVDRTPPPVYALFMILPVALPLYALFLPCRWFTSKYRLRSTTQLAKQVLESDPGSDIGKWDLISSILNTTLYREGISGTPYFFFNGEYAQRMFLETIFLPYLKGKFKESNMNEIESSKIYLQSLKGTFEFSLRDNLPDLLSEMKLPRDTDKSRYLSIPGYQIMVVRISIFYGQLIFYLFDSLFRQTIDLPLLFIYLYLSLTLILLNGPSSISRCLLYPEVNMFQGMKFLAVICKVVPRRHLHKWDDIAKYMNQQLVDDETLQLGKFFDGKHCLEFYQKYFQSVSARDSQSRAGVLIDIFKFTQPSVE